VVHATAAWTTIQYGRVQPVAVPPVMARPPVGAYIAWLNAPTDRIGA
jgi:hypothetical protein